MSRFGSFLLVVLTACGGGSRGDEVAALVSQTFATQNPAGRIGVEVTGKGVWYNTSSLDASCLRGKQWAFQDDRAASGSGKAKSKLSPVYAEQRNFVTSTEKGYCVFVGADPTIEIADVSWVNARTATSSGAIEPSKAADLEGVYTVAAKVALKAPAGWGECLADTAKMPIVQVAEKRDGTLEIIGGRVDLGQGDCPMPLPLGEDRKGAQRPSKPAPAPPSLADVRAVAKSFDDAVRARDYVGARAALSCYNLFETEKYGTCSAGELVGVGPLPGGSGNFMEPPWSDGVFDSLDALGRVFPDAKDKTMFHVEVMHKKTKQPRTLAVQWVDGAWKLVAVVSVKAEGLTAPRFVYDLDQKERREVFERRLGGEPVDERGEPLDPEERAKAE